MTGPTGAVKNAGQGVAGSPTSQLLSRPPLPSRGSRESLNPSRRSPVPPGALPLARRPVAARPPTPRHEAAARTDRTTRGCSGATDEPAVTGHAGAARSAQPEPGRQAAGRQTSRQTSRQTTGDGQETAGKRSPGAATGSAKPLLTGR